MPQHFVLTQHLSSSTSIADAVTIQIQIAGSAVTQYSNENWLDGQRALQLDDGNGNGWVFILPSDGTITRGNGDLIFERTLPSLNAGVEESLSVLVLPLATLSTAQQEAYLYPTQYTSVQYAQLDRAGVPLSSLFNAVWDETRGAYLVELNALTGAGAPNHPN